MPVSRRYWASGCWPTSTKTAGLRKAEVDARTTAQHDADDALVELAERALNSCGRRGIHRLTNRVALCGRHHHLIHHTDWWIDMTGGIPRFHPPPWLGGAPRRNHVHAAPDSMRIRE